MASPGDISEGYRVAQAIVSWAGWPVTLAFLAGCVAGGLVVRYFLARRSHRRSLVFLREHGVRLMTRYVGNDIQQQVKFLEQDCAMWERWVSEALKKLGVPEERVSYFRVLGPLSRPTHPGASGEHAHTTTITAEKLDRLQIIMQGIHPVFPWRYKG